MYIFWIRETIFFYFANWNTILSSFSELFFLLWHLILLYFLTFANFSLIHKLIEKKEFFLLDSLKIITEVVYVEIRKVFEEVPKISSKKKKLLLKLIMYVILYKIIIFILKNIAYFFYLNKVVHTLANNREQICNFHGSRPFLMHRGYLLHEESHGVKLLVVVLIQYKYGLKLVHYYTGYR